MPVSENDISFMEHSYQEIDAAVDQVAVNAAAITDLQTSKADASALIAATNKLTAALADIIDSTGAKNRLSVNSGTTGSGAGYFVQDLPINLAPGDYVAKMTRDTSGQLTIVVRDASNNDLARISKASGVTDFEEEFTITGTAAKVSVYVGFSVTVTNAMICSKAAYEISSAFVPYAPTNAELYEMLQSSTPTAMLSQQRTSESEEPITDEEWRRSV